MTMRVCRNAAIAAIGLSITAGLVRVHGQAAVSLSPALDITHHDQLWGRVWPGDFNGDGITDLAASAPRQSIPLGPPSTIQIVLGDGRGGFGPPIATSAQGTVAGVGDFNNDHRLDVVAFDETGHVIVLPGNGNGTFANALVAVPGGGDDEPAYAVSADLDGDGNRDLVVGALVYPGHGDFTFGAAIRVDSHSGAADEILVDVNGDGRKDLLIANRAFAGIVVALNRGGFQFTTSFITGPWPTDVTAADMNGDGKVDIVVSESLSTNESFNTGRGRAGILFGHGDGTFGAPVYYDTAQGAWQVVVGDFNRDGVLDIATANRSSIFSDDFCDGRKTWDSVSVLPGRGDGTFDTASSFSLGDQSDVRSSTTDERFKNNVLTLNTSDLNGDGQTDLIASFGVVLLNAPARANRPPTVDAGADFAATFHEVQVPSRAQDPDGDMLEWRWTTRLGDVIASWPSLCDADLHEGNNVFTVSVDDGHGHVASDSITIAWLPNGPVQDGGAAVAGAPAGDNWRHQDIGAVASAGSVTFEAGRFTVTGSGADIWGTADEFQYVHQLTGFERRDVDFVTRVDSFSGPHGWSKAGLMLRESLDPGSRQVSLFVTPGHGVAFQYRMTADQASTTVPGPLWTAPVWLRLSVRTNTVNAYYKRNAADPWTKLAGNELPDSWGRWLYDGLAVTSHADGAPATAVFSNVSLRVPQFTPSVIGGGSGSATLDRRWGTLVNRGTDIWNTADQLTFLSIPTDGAATIESDIEDIFDTSPWAKAGLMFRESPAADAANVAIVATPGKGISFQWRAASGETSHFVTPAPGGPGVSLRLTRSGNQFTGEWRNGGTWQTLGSIDVAMRPEILVGLAATSHNPSAATTAYFSGLVVRR